jgi:hypothetical protein
MVFAMRYPRVVLVCIAVLTVAAAVHLGKLQITITPQALVADGKPEQRLYEDTVTTFGPDQVTVVYIRDPDLFNAEKLAAVRDAVAALEALPFVARTRSLFSVPEVRVRDELITTAPYLEALPETAQQVERIRAAALMNPFVRHNLLSRDGSTLAINVHLAGSAYSPMRTRASPLQSTRPSRRSGTRSPSPGRWGCPTCAARSRNRPGRSSTGCWPADSPCCCCRWRCCSAGAAQCLSPLPPHR